MEFKVTDIVGKSFNLFVEKYGFCHRNEIIDDQSQTYSIEYISNVFIIRLERYRHEFYVLVYKAGSVDEEIDLFNLLDYLNLSATDFNFFRKTPSIEERYRKQLANIALILEKYLAEITQFFKRSDYDVQIANIKQFMINKYPELFKTIREP